jgi:hypothetical protein
MDIDNGLTEYDEKYTAYLLENINEGNIKNYFSELVSRYKNNPTKIYHNIACWNLFVNKNKERGRLLDWFNVVHINNILYLYNNKHVIYEIPWIANDELDRRTKELLPAENLELNVSKKCYNLLEAGHINILNSIQDENMIALKYGNQFFCVELDQITKIYEKNTLFDKNDNSYESILWNRDTLVFINCAQKNIDSPDMYGSFQLIPDYYLIPMASYNRMIVEILKNNIRIFELVKIIDDIKISNMGYWLSFYNKKLYKKIKPIKGHVAIKSYGYNCDDKRLPIFDIRPLNYKFSKTTGLKDDEEIIKKSQEVIEQEKQEREKFLEKVSEKSNKLLERNRRIQNYLADMKIKPIIDVISKFTPDCNGNYYLNYMKPVFRPIMMWCIPLFQKITCTIAVSDSEINDSGIRKVMDSFNENYYNDEDDENIETIKIDMINIYNGITEFRNNHQYNFSIYNKLSMMMRTERNMEVPENIMDAINDDQKIQLENAYKLANDIYDDKKVETKDVYESLVNVSKILLNIDYEDTYTLTTSQNICMTLLEVFQAIVDFKNIEDKLDNIETDVIKLLPSGKFINTNITKLAECLDDIVEIEIMQKFCFKDVMISNYLKYKHFHLFVYSYITCKMSAYILIDECGYNVSKIMNNMMDAFRMIISAFIGEF